MPRLSRILSPPRKRALIDIAEGREPHPGAARALFQIRLIDGEPGAWTCTAEGLRELAKIWRPPDDGIVPGALVRFRREREAKGCFLRLSGRSTEKYRRTTGERIGPDMIWRVSQIRGGRCNLVSEVSVRYRRGEPEMMDGAQGVVHVPINWLEVANG